MTTHRTPFVPSETPEARKLREALEKFRQMERSTPFAYAPFQANENELTNAPFAEAPSPVARPAAVTGFDSPQSVPQFTSGKPVTPAPSNPLLQRPRTLMPGAEVSEPGSRLSFGSGSVQTPHTPSALESMPQALTRDVRANLSENKGLGWLATPEERAAYKEAMDPVNLQPVYTEGPYKGLPTVATVMNALMAGAAMSARAGLTTDQVMAALQRPDVVTALTRAEFAPAARTAQQLLKGQRSGNIAPAAGAALDTAEKIIKSERGMATVPGKGKQPTPASTTDSISQSPSAPVRAARGVTYDSIQQEIDALETKLIQTYGEDAVLFGEMPRYKTDPLPSTVRKPLQDLYAARDAVGRAEDSNILSKLVAGLSSESLRGPATKDEITKVLKTIQGETNLSFALHGVQRYATERALTSRLYNSLAHAVGGYTRGNVTIPETLTNLDEAMQVVQAFREGHGPAIYGQSPEPLINQVRSIMRDVMGASDTKPMSALPSSSTAPVGAARSAEAGRPPTAASTTAVPAPKAQVSGLASQAQPPQGASTPTGPWRQGTAPPAVPKPPVQPKAPPMQPPAPPKAPVPAATPPTPPPPPASTVKATAPPASSGNTFVGDFRPFADVTSEVVTSDNAFVRGVAGRTGLNPSVLQNNPVGKALVGYQRQLVAADELTDVAVSSALDTHMQRVTGRMGDILPIDQQGMWKGTTKRWEDVMSRPGDYSLTQAQKAYVGDYHQVIDEVEALRVAHGLDPRAKVGPEGWFYVPRQVEGIRGVELRRPSSPKLQRLYDEATSGAARGVDYSKDPRANLSLHVRTAYREIAEAQLAEALEPLSITAKDLVKQPIKDRLANALKDYRQTVRNGRKAIEDARKDLARQANTPRQIANRQADLAKLNATIAQVAADNAAAKATARQAQTAYTRAMEAARKAEVADAGLFGGNVGETIGIGQWRNRFFPREQADALKAALDAKRTANFVTRAFEVTGNTTRFLSSVGDFAEPFIQGLPVLARDPVTWGKATAKHYQAFFDPTVQARYVREHLDTFKEMARYGIPVGDPEFFAAMREGGGPSFGKVLPEAARGAAQNVGRQTFGRFQATYNTGLGVSRALLWDSLKGKYAGNLDELAQYIRNMTGGLDSRALGVGPNQRAAEGIWMAFSPRLLRSTVALVGDAVRPGSVGGREALRTIGQLAAGATGIYVATGLALGKTQEEIVEGLNPLSGKRFMAHEVNGEFIGMGGQMRAFLQVAAGVASAAAPGGKPAGDLLTSDPYNNPLLSFYMGRGAPGIRMAGGLLEGLSGGRADFLPYERVDSLPSLAANWGTAALPFTVQGILEGQSPLTSIAGLGGARTAPEDSAFAATARDFNKAFPKAKGLGVELGYVGYNLSLTDDIAGAEYKLTDAQRDAYQRLTANFVIKALKRDLPPTYDRLPDRIKANVLKKTMQQAKGDAREFYRGILERQMAVSAP